MNTSLNLSLKIKQNSDSFCCNKILTTETYYVATEINGQLTNCAFMTLMCPLFKDWTVFIGYDITAT